MRRWVIVSVALAFSACSGESPDSASKATTVPMLTLVVPVSIVPVPTNAPTSTVPTLTVPTPITVAIPIAPWSGPSVPAPAALADLASSWYSFFYPDLNCPLLAPTAELIDIGATGPPSGPDVGTAGGGPFIRWPGDGPTGEGSGSLFVVPAPLTIGDPNLEPFYAEGIEPTVFADGSQERLAGDGLSSLILLPGVGCGYVFTWPEAHAPSQNFGESLRVISAPT